MEPHRPLDFYAGPLVWVDCEMTGLNPRKDKILEIAVRFPPPNKNYIHIIEYAFILGHYHERKPGPGGRRYPVCYSYRQRSAGWVSFTMCPTGVYLMDKLPAWMNGVRSNTHPFVLFLRNYLSRLALDILLVARLALPKTV